MIKYIVQNSQRINKNEGKKLAWSYTTQQVHLERNIIALNHEKIPVSPNFENLTMKTLYHEV